MKTFEVRYKYEDSHPMKKGIQTSDAFVHAILSRWLVHPDLHIFDLHLILQPKMGICLCQVDT